MAAPAKINLFLEILARRNDGFHDLETLMLAVNIYDTVELTATDDGSFELECCLPISAEAKGGAGLRRASVFSGLTSDEDNLVWQALALLRDAANIPSGAKVRLIKRIPLGAGMGGGSSDAAAVLWAANRAWKLNWGLDQLLPLALRLGSDVPFFMEEGPAICRGRGEQITRVDVALRLPLVVAHPGVGLSTAEVYRGCRLPSRPVPVEPLLEALRRGIRAEIARTIVNRLEPSALAMLPEIEDLRNDIRQWIGQGNQMTGCQMTACQMTGSGAACFGICPSLRHARRAARWLRGKGWPFATAAQTVASSARTRLNR